MHLAVHRNPDSLALEALTNDGQLLVNWHDGQMQAWDSDARVVAMLAGTQGVNGSKTSSEGDSNSFVTGSGRRSWARVVLSGSLGYGMLPSTNPTIPRKTTV